MKLSRVFVIALMIGAFAVLGCGDSGQSASEVCDACEVSSLRGACESAFNTCINVDRGGHEECVAAGLLACGGEV